MNWGFNITFKTFDLSSMPDNSIHREQQEMQEVIGAMPSKIWRRGILLVSGFVVLMIVVANFVRYPDVIEVPVALKVSEVVTVGSQVRGVLKEIKAEGEEMVEKGDVLAVLDGAFDYESVVTLQSFLNTVISQNTVAQLAAIQFPANLDFSVLPADAVKLRLDLSRLNQESESSQLDQKVFRLNNEKEIIKRLATAVRKQIEKTDQEIALAEKNYQDYKNLLDAGAASGVETDAAQATLLRLQAVLESQKADLIRHELNLSAVDTRIEFLEQEAEQALKKELIQIQSRASDLSGKIQNWMETFVIKAPVSGKIAIPAQLLEGQTLLPEHPLFSIILSDAGEKPAAIGQMSGSGTGKVEAGMKAYVRLQAFPYKEFGELAGIVESIGNVPATGYYETIITFDQSAEQDPRLQTVTLKPGMTGIARIITKDRSLLQRFLEIFQF